MAYKISDECISCGACEAGCPVNAISEGDGKYVIDADTCIDCGAFNRGNSFLGPGKLPMRGITAPKPLKSHQGCW